MAPNGTFFTVLIWVGCQPMMGLGAIWKNYRLLIVMVPGVALIHWGWHSIQSNPMFQPKRDELDTESAVVTPAWKKENRAKGK